MKNMLGQLIRFIGIANDLAKGELAEIVTLITDFLTKAADNYEEWVTAFKKFLRKENPWTPDAILESQLKSWKKFYQKHFGLDLDLSNLVIPERVPGFDRLIVVAKGMTANRAYDVCVAKFPCSRYVNDLDAAFPTNDRVATKTYAIWVRDRVEADEENKNKSANTLATEKHQGITLTEHLIWELKYFSETGKHLDLKNWTLCSGSRDSDGSVPDVYWLDGRLHVYWFFLSNAIDDLRARSVVS